MASPQRAGGWNGRATPLLAYCWTPGRIAQQSSRVQRDKLFLCFVLCIHSARNIPAVTNAAALRYANSKYCMDMSGGEVSNGGAADAKVTRTCI